MSFRVADKQKRSKSGCWTCRSKKVKCDEHRPICHRCDRLNLICDYLPRNKIKTRFIDESSLVIRRAHNAALQQQKHNPSDNKALIRTIKLIQSVPPQMSQERQTSASSLELSLADHKAIRYFRTVFAKIYATKNPEYSLFAIVFDIAERDPMVMRAILALGGQCIQHRRQIALAEAPPVPHTAAAAAQNPLQHYSAALRMMADTLDQREAYACFLHDLDSILATLYLMFLYEKTFGVGDELGLSNHLSGAAHLVEDRLREQSRPLQFPRRNPLANRVAGKSSDAALFRFFNARQRDEQPLSLFSARILVHLAVQDSNASTFGFGGQLMTTLNSLTGDPEATWPFADGALMM